MDGLSDHNSFSEVELKELATLPSSSNGHNVIQQIMTRLAHG